MTTYEDAIRQSMAKGAEYAKASAESKERDINGNGMYWYGKALEYKQMHEIAERRERDTERVLRNRTTERDYHKRLGDQLAENLSEAKKVLDWLDERAKNSTSHGSHCHAYEVAARKLLAALAPSSVSNGEH